MKKILNLLFILLLTFVFVCISGFTTNTKNKVYYLKQEYSVKQFTSDNLNGSMECATNNFKVGYKTSKNDSVNSSEHIKDGSDYLRLYGANSINGNSIETTSCLDGYIISLVKITVNNKENFKLQFYGSKDNITWEKTNKVVENSGGVKTYSCPTFKYKLIKIVNESKDENSSAYISSFYITFISDEKIQELQVLDFNKTQTKMSLNLNYTTTDNTYNVSKVDLRLGLLMSALDYDKFSSNNATFGVIVNKENGTTKSFDIVPERVDKTGKASATGDYYQFALVLTDIPLAEKDVIVNGRCFIKIDNISYYNNIRTTSVKLAAQEYLNRQDTTAYSKHLGVLEYLAN